MWHRVLFTPIPTVLSRRTISSSTMTTSNSELLQDTRSDVNPTSAGSPPVPGLAERSSTSAYLIRHLPEEISVVPKKRKGIEERRADQRRIDLEEDIYTTNVMPFSAQCTMCLQKIVSVQQSLSTCPCLWH